jgi:hypothetical protein
MANSPSGARRSPTHPHNRAPIAGSHRRDRRCGTGSSTAREGQSSTTIRPFTARHAGGLFFPVAGSMGLSARAKATPKLTEKVVWAGSNIASFAMAEEATRKLAEQDVSSGRIRRTSRRGACCRTDRVGRAAQSDGLVAAPPWHRSPRVAPNRRGDDGRRALPTA